ncbi:MAG: hypothetical protein WC211_03745 [Dehalococcoidia bacterium]
MSKMGWISSRSSDVMPPTSRQRLAAADRGGVRLFSVTLTSIQFPLPGDLERVQILGREPSREPDLPRLDPRQERVVDRFP